MIWKEGFHVSARLLPMPLGRKHTRKGAARVNEFETSVHGI